MVGGRSPAEMMVALAAFLCLAVGGQGSVPGDATRLALQPATSDDVPGSLWRVVNPDQALVATFDDAGVRLATRRGGHGGGWLELRLRGWGRDASEELSRPVLPVVDGSRLEYWQPGLVASFDNRVDGLHLAIALDHPGEQLVVDIGVATNLEPILAEQALRLTDPDGAGADLRLELESVRDDAGQDRRAGLTFDRLDGYLRLTVDEPGMGPVTITFVVTRTGRLPPPLEDNARGGYASSVAVDANLMVVGAPDDDALGAGSGAAWLFRRDAATGAWREEAKLTASDGAPFDHFGRAVAIRSGIVAIGAPDHDGAVVDAGAVYVFAQPVGSDSWVESDRLLASESFELDRFGAAIAIGGEAAAGTIVVGAPADPYDGPGVGAAFFFERADGAAWGEVTAYRAGPEFLDGSYGMAVAINGDTVAVGSQFFRLGTDRYRSVQVFRRSELGWAQAATLQSTHKVQQDRVGCVLALSGDQLAVRDRYSNSPAVLVFSRAPGAVEQWDLVDYLFAPFGHDSFGDAMDIAGESMAIAAPSATVDGVASGAVFVYRRSDSAAEPWRLDATLTSSNPVSYLRFGGALAFDHTRPPGYEQLAVGAAADHWDSLGLSAAFVLEQRPGEGWDERARLPQPASLSSRWQAFGAALAGRGDVVVVGAPNQGFPDLSGPGRAYVLKHAGDQSPEWFVAADLEGASSVPADRLFGAVVSATAGRVAVLAPKDAAYVFARDPAGDGWPLEARLPIPTDDAPWPRGKSVAIRGTTLAVGRTGAVAVYELDAAAGWVEVATLRGEEQDSEHFGEAVALEHDTLVVGSPWDYGIDWPAPPPRRASVQVFSRHTGGAGAWDRAAVLTAPEAAVGTGFGEVVAISGGTVVVGAPETDSLAELAGAAFVFALGPEGWRQVAELVPAHATDASRTCSSVAIDGDLVVVGSRWAPAPPPWSGRGTVTVFRRDHGGHDAWGEVTSIGPDDDGDRFGTAVWLEHGRVWVGAPDADDAGEGSGAVIVYEVDRLPPLARPLDVQ